MPKIRNWSRRHDLENMVTRVWEHDETGEIAWLSEKVPNDGYYLMVCSSLEEFEDNKHANSNRHGYSHLKYDALQIASGRLRSNEEGFHA